MERKYGIFEWKGEEKKKRKESFQLSNLSDLLLPGLLIIFVPTTFTVFAQIADKNKALISLIAISTDRSHRIYIYIYNTYFPLLECSCIYINSETRFTIRRSMLRDLCWIEHRTRIVTSNVSSFHRCSRRSLQADNEAVALPAERL